MQFWKSASRLPMRRFARGRSRRRQQATGEVTEHYDALVQDAQRMRKSGSLQRQDRKLSAEYGRIVSEAKDKADGIVEKAKADAADMRKLPLMQQADAAVRDMVVTAAARMVADEGRQKRATVHLYDKFLAETKEA